MRSALDAQTALTINPARVARMLYVLVGVLAIAHVAVHGVLYVFGETPAAFEGVYRFFNMGSEANLPAYVSALYLLMAAGLLAIIGRRTSERPRGEGNRLSRWHWWGLAIGFLIMSFDEAAQIHEGVVGAFLLETLGRGEGIFYYVWYVVYVPLLLIIGLVYVPFLRRLPRRYASWFLLSGAVFVGGAVGIEMVESYLSYSRQGGQSVSRLFEETCEMLGVALFIHALLVYLTEAQTSLVIRFGQVQETEPSMPVVD